MSSLITLKWRMQLTSVGLIILAMLSAGSSCVNAVEPSRADRILELRLAAMVAQSGTVPALAAMVNGKSPYEPKRALVLAERAATLASMSSETFPDESKAAAKSLARAEVWSERAEFNQLMQRTSRRAQLLCLQPKAAQSRHCDPRFWTLHGPAGAAMRDLNSYREGGGTIERRIETIGGRENVFAGAMRLAR